MNKNNTSKIDNFFIIVANVIFYILAAPFIIVFGVSAIALTSVFILAYLLIALITWPFNRNKNYDDMTMYSAAPDKLEGLAEIAGSEHNDA